MCRNDMFASIETGAEGSFVDIDRLEPYKIPDDDFIPSRNMPNQLANEHIHNVIHAYL